MGATDYSRGGYPNAGPLRLHMTFCPRYVIDSDTTLSEGPISLERAAHAICSAPLARGIDDRCEVRSVLIVGQGGKWVNHCTVLHVGSTVSSSVEKIEDRVVSKARLIGSAASAQSINSQSALIDILTTWRCSLPKEFLESINEGKYGTAVQEPPWEFQLTGNAYHHASKNPWGTLPCWVIDLYDRRTPNVGTVLPRGPFRDRQASEFAVDVGALTKNWCRDETWRQFTTVQNAYRVVIPDRRGFIDDIRFEDRRLRVIVVQGIAPHLECAVTTIDTNGKDASETKAVSEGQIAFDLPAGPRSVELYLVDDSDEWCDNYRRYQIDASPPVGLEQAGSAPASDTLLDQLLAPRYVAVRAQLVKAMTFASPGQNDFPNAVKEAVCAVESIARVVTGKHDSTLGQIVRSLKKEKNIDPAIASTLKGFWSYTSNLSTVRHGGVSVPSINAPEFQVVLDKVRASIIYFLSRDL